MKLKQFYDQIEQRAKLDEPVFFYLRDHYDSVFVDGAKGATFEADLDSGLITPKVNLTMVQDSAAPELLASDMLDVLEPFVESFGDKPIVRLTLRTADGKEMLVVEDDIWGSIEFRGDNEFACARGDEGDDLLDAYAISPADLAIVDAMEDSVRGLFKGHKSKEHDAHVRYAEGEPAEQKSAVPRAYLEDNPRRRQRVGFILNILMMAAGIFAAILAVRIAARLGGGKEMGEAICMVLCLVIVGAIMIVRKVFTPKDLDFKSSKPEQPEGPEKK